MDYNFITSRLATGAAINTDIDVQTLVKAGITHIINCRKEFDDASLLKSYQIKYLFNGVNDDGKPKSVDWFQNTIEFGLPALADSKQKVYVHCAAGISRGPSSAYAILRAFGLSAQDAEDMIKKVRPQVRITYKKDADLAIKQLGFE